MFAEMNVKKAAIGTSGACLLLIGIWCAWWGRPPQVGADKESMKVVDALYTAVSSHNPTRLADCEQRLHTLRDDGKLPRAAADYLDGLMKNVERQATRIANNGGADIADSFLEYL